MKVRCLFCGHEVEPVEDREKHILRCPDCEAEILSSVESEMETEEIMPGIRAGQRLGAYEVVDFIGRGGMAVLVKGRQLSLDRTVAIKILPKRFTSNRLFLARFAGEATALAGLNHPNIVNVIDRGKEGSFYFIVMEYIEGEDLRKRLGRAGPLRQGEALRISRQVLAALQYAHAKGIIHRDIKPGNIMITRHGLVKVTDFGLAQLAGDRGALFRTLTGQMMGTLKYMAPEQLMDAKNVDARCDLYSLGVVLYEMLTGRLPVGAFRMPTELAPELDPRIDEVLGRALRTDPAERFADAGEFAAALDRIQGGADGQSADAQQREWSQVQPPRMPSSAMACRACGHESDPASHSCEGCGASLEHLFGPCPQCSTAVRADMAKCPSCGAEMESSRLVARADATEAESRVKNMVAERQYEEAIVELRKMEARLEPEFEQARTIASSWIPKIEKRLRARRQQIYDAARKMLAEGDLEKAVELLGRLPDEYADVAGLAASAKENIRVGTELRRRAEKAERDGRRQAALELYGKAAEIWPRDIKLRAALLKLRTELADRRMAGKRLAEARVAAVKGNYAEAVELCRHAAELDGDDASIVEFLESLREKERESLTRGAQIIRPAYLAFGDRMRARRRLIVIVALVSAAVLIGVVALVVGFMPGMEERAARRMAAAEALEGSGDLEGAVAGYRRVISNYPTSASKPAAEMKIVALAQVIERCDKLVSNADSRYDRGRLAEAAAMYNELLGDSACGRSGRHAAHARERIGQIRRKFTDDGMAFEKSRRLQRALEEYRKAVAVSKSPPPELSEAVARVEGRLSLFAALVGRADEALSRNDFAAAQDEIGRATDIMPGDPRLLSTIGSLLTRSPAAEGMVYVPPGEFVMGADDGDSDEAPRRRATLEHGCYIDAFEVTNRQYQEFVLAGGAPPPQWRDGGAPAGQEEFPVVNVRWADAEAYARWRGKRLPSEAEWERAARGANGMQFTWGDKWDDSAGAFQVGPERVGARARDVSPTGCRDMAGNVAEWTADAWDGGVKWRVAKGGSWAGPEPQRSVRPVFAEPVAATTRGVDFVLADCADQPVLPVMFDKDLCVSFRAFAGSRERAEVIVQKWLPDLQQWVSGNFVAKLGDEIGQPMMVVPPGAERGGKSVRVDFSTGYTVAGFGRDEDAPVRYRRPDGAVCALKRESVAKREAPAGLRYLAEPLGARLHSLAGVSRCANRIKAPADGRFVNVGFRCAETPRLLQALIAE